MGFLANRLGIARLSLLISMAWVIGVVVYGVVLTAGHRRSDQHTWTILLWSVPTILLCTNLLPWLLERSQD